MGAPPKNTKHVTWNLNVESIPSSTEETSLVVRKRLLVLADTVTETLRTMRLMDERLLKKQKQGE